MAIAMYFNPPSFNAAQYDEVDAALEEAEARARGAHAGPLTQRHPTGGRREDLSRSPAHIWSARPFPPPFPPNVAELVEEATY
jgi:hypothetical protein